MVVSDISYLGMCAAKGAVLVWDMHVLCILAWNCVSCLDETNFPH